MNRTIELSIQGMSCGSCVRHVDTALRGVDGVREATVDLARGRATVVADEGVSVEALRTALTDAGYEATAVT